MTQQLRALRGYGLQFAPRRLEFVTCAQQVALKRLCPSRMLSSLHRQHASAYVSIRQHTSAYVSIRQHTSAYVSIRQRM